MSSSLRAEAIVFIPKHKKVITTPTKSTTVIAENSTKSAKYNNQATELSAFRQEESTEQHGWRNDRRKKLVNNGDRGFKRRIQKVHNESNSKAHLVQNMNSSECSSIDNKDTCSTATKKNSRKGKNDASKVKRPHSNQQQSDNQKYEPSVSLSTNRHSRNHLMNGHEGVADNKNSNRRRRMRPRNHISHGYNGSDLVLNTSESYVMEADTISIVVDDEKTFPSLVRSKEDQRNSSLQTKCAWTDDNLKSKIVNQRREHNSNQQVKDGNEERFFFVNDKSQSTELTLLRKQTISASGGKPIHVNTSKPVDNENKVGYPSTTSEDGGLKEANIGQIPDTVCQSELNNSAALLCGPKTTLSINSMLHPSKSRCVRNLDMNRLRDRWWDVLQQHFNNRLTQAELNSPKNDLEGESLSTDNNHYTTQAYERICDLGLSASSFDIVEEATDQSKIIQPLKSSVQCLGLQYLLNDAIRKNDVDTLKHILEGEVPVEIFLSFLKNEDQCDETSLLQFVVSSNRPHLLKEFMNACRRMNIDWCSLDYGHDCSLHPLLIAAEHGCDECIEIMLRSLTTSPTAVLLTTRDADGNTALHYSSRYTAPVSTFQLLLDFATKTGTSSSSLQVTKLLSSKNYSNQQTPLHVACAFGRADLVEFILNKTGNTTTLSKLLVSQDAIEQTPLLTAIASRSSDIVMSLLMWRGNNTLHYRYRYITPAITGATTNKSCVPAAAGSSFSHVLPCPLIWAVKHARSVDMVLLLLEFNNPSSENGYNLDYALRTAVDVRLSACSNKGQSDNDQDMNMLEIIRGLVEAGANPCSIAEVDKNCSSRVSRSSCVPTITLAAECGDYECLVLLVDAYRLWLDQVQTTRRRDPKLQKQPQSFFYNIESKETAELTFAMRDALITSLFCSWKNNTIRSPTCKAERRDVIVGLSFLTCSLALYRRGTLLDLSDIRRLKRSLTTGVLEGPSDEIPGSSTNPEYEASYLRVVPIVEKQNEQDDSLQASSLAFLKMPWCPLLKAPRSTKNTGCIWIERQLLRDVFSPEQDGMKSTSKICGFLFGEPDVILVCSDGTRFPSHSLLISESSLKLAAAIRFTSLSCEKNHGDLDEKQGDLQEELIEIDVDVPGRMMKWMLEHIYHGSIVVGRFSNRSSQHCYKDLLELMMIADEFLCPSLVQECEMRLLAHDYRRCFCWYCNRTTRVNETQTPTIGKTYQKLKCSYTISGPSQLVTAEGALDAIATAQQLGIMGSWEHPDYIILNNVNFSSKELQSPHHKDCLISRRPLESLLEVAVGVLLQDLGKVIKTDTFISSLNFLMSEDAQYRKLMEAEQTRACESLIDILLHELQVLGAAEVVNIDSRTIQIQKCTVNSLQQIC